jgi:hypothetical protein
VVSKDVGGTEIILIRRQLLAAFGKRNFSVLPLPTLSHMRWLSIDDLRFNGVNDSMASISAYYRSRQRRSSSIASQGLAGSRRSSTVRTNEASALLGEEHDRPQLWLQIASYLYHTIKATIYCSKANLLLVFIPLSVIATAQNWHPVAVFAISFLAIFPLAELLSWSTEQLAASVGQTLGGLLNATFGNAVEMIVRRALYRITEYFVLTGLVRLVSLP